MELVDKIQKIAKREADQLKYIYKGMLIGCCHIVFKKAGVPTVNPIPEEYFDAFISGLIDSFYGGCEPEFETEAEYNKFQDNINFVKSAEWLYDGYTTNPYRDKSIPYLGIKPNKTNKIY